jgi:glycine/D-amino acid oxidase-like deaminating enzyme
MHRASLLSAIFYLSMLAPGSARAASAEPRAADIIVYGGTAAGIVAAVQAARMGQSVILLEPGTHLGGTTTGGLSASDVGRAWTLGGIALEFYRAIYAYYLDDTVWKKETREEYLPKHRLIYSEDLGAQWFFEPHVAEHVLRGMLAKYAIPVVTDARLNRKE